MKLSLAILFVTVAACQPAPASPSNDAGDSSTPVKPPPPADVPSSPLSDASSVCFSACKKLSDLGCSQGKADTCPGAWETAEIDGLIHVPDGGAAVTCAMVANAASKSDLAAMGVACTP